nr:MAG TPA: hypothetical protein [Bacteriophage sp.]
MKTLSEQFKETLALMNKDIFDKLYKILDLDNTKVRYIEDGYLSKLRKENSPEFYDLRNIDLIDGDLYLNVDEKGNIVISWLDTDDDYNSFITDPEFFDDFESYYNKYKQKIDTHNKVEQDKYNAFLAKIEEEKRQMESKKKDKRYQEYLKLKEEFQGL